MPGQFIELKLDARRSPYDEEPRYSVEATEGHYGQCLILGVGHVSHPQASVTVILYREDAVTLARAILARWDTKPEGKPDHD